MGMRPRQMGSAAFAPVNSSFFGIFIIPLDF